MSSTATTVLTLDMKYRPTTQIAFPVINRANTGGDGYGLITINGALQLRNALTSTAYFDFVVTYPTI